MKQKGNVVCIKHAQIKLDKDSGVLLGKLGARWRTGGVSDPTT